VVVVLLRAETNLGRVLERLRKAYSGQWIEVAGEIAAGVLHGDRRNDTDVGRRPCDGGPSSDDFRTRRRDSAHR
jgi:hypothetical protein